MGWRALVLLLAGLLLAGCGGGVHPVPGTVAGATSTAAVRTERIAGRSLCAGPRIGPLDYGWPLRPFDVQHPVRANFGDPRTVSAELFGLDDLGDPGDYSFHNGVDISAKPGTPVFPVVSGIAVVRHRDEVLVHAVPSRRSFQYWHITPAVHDGEHVVADVTVLGYVQAPARHVHLSEIDNQRVTNPARHLRPYNDWTAPTVLALTFGNTHRQLVEPNALTGQVSITAQADDMPSIPVPGAWGDFPVTPVLLRWTLLGPNHVRIGRIHTIADFRRTEPPQRDFWNVYAAGTFQNFPVFDHRYYWRVSGRYLFKLTRQPLDTTRLPNGTYTFHVIASDLCGNQGTLTQRLRVSNRDDLASAQAAGESRR